MEDWEVTGKGHSSVLQIHSCPKESPTSESKKLPMSILWGHWTEHANKGEFERAVFWVEVTLGIFERESAIKSHHRVREGNRELWSWAKVWPTQPENGVTRW